MRPDQTQIRNTFNAIEQGVDCHDSSVFREFSIFDRENRFDVVLTGKMTELDQFMYRFRILSKNAIEQGVDCYDSSMFKEFSIFDRRKTGLTSI